MKTKTQLTESANKIKVNKERFTIPLLSNTCLLYSCFFLAIITFTSCEENMWLRSEKKLRSEFTGTWNRLFVTANVKVVETWTFKDGRLTIVETEKIPNSKDDNYNDLNDTDGLDTLTVDIGNYNIDAKLDNAYLKLEHLERNVVESAKQGLNSKWTIVDIGDGLLYIAAENHNAIIQREFKKK